MGFGRILFERNDFISNEIIVEYHVKINCMDKIYGKMLKFQLIYRPFLSAK